MADAASVAESIAMTEAKGAVLALPPESTLEDKLRVAMKVTRGHWLIVQLGAGPFDGLELRAAVGAVVAALGLEHPDSARLIAEHKALAKLSAAIEAIHRGVNVDFERMSEEFSDVDTSRAPIGIMRIWNEERAR